MIDWLTVATWMILSFELFSVLGFCFSVKVCNFFGDSVLDSYVIDWFTVGNINLKV